MQNRFDFFQNVADEKQQQQRQPRLHWHSDLGVQPRKFFENVGKDRVREMGANITTLVDRLMRGINRGWKMIDCLRISHIRDEERHMQPFLLTVGEKKPV